MNKETLVSIINQALEEENTVKEMSMQLDAVSNIPHGDMPGDIIKIEDTHISKAKTIFPNMLKEIKTISKEKQTAKIVVSVCGGSGVGKSEIASLLSYMLCKIGINCYTLSGDNYPHRIPMYNDAERLRIFRSSGVRELVAENLLDTGVVATLKKIQTKEDDANLKYAEVTSDEYYSWFKIYMDGAINGLKSYLGTNNEINFAEVTDIIAQFKTGINEIYLKRMGRNDVDLWYDKVDFTDINVLIVEWTHGNSNNFEGVDIPILLNSTPEETMAHRRARNRDGKVDSAFTTRILEIEQGMLISQAHKAKIIVAKTGELLTYAQYKKIMED